MQTPLESPEHVLRYTEPNARRRCIIEILMSIKKNMKNNMKIHKATLSRLLPANDEKCIGAENYVNMFFSNCKLALFWFTNKSSRRLNYVICSYAINDVMNTDILIAFYSSLVFIDEQSERR